MTTSNSGDLKPKFQFCLIAVVFMILLSPLAVQAETVIGKITRLKGSALIYRLGEPKPISVRLGLPVQLQDEIKTSAASRVRIELKDGSILTMDAEADLCLDRFEFDPEKRNRNAEVRMLIGKFRVFAKDLLKFKKKDFKVRTPTAVIGVRGTFFLVWVKMAPFTETDEIDDIETDAMAIDMDLAIRTVTRVTCLEGVVHVANLLDPAGYVVLTEGQSTDVVETLPPAPPIEVLGTTTTTTTQPTTTTTTSTTTTTTTTTTQPSTTTSTSTSTTSSTSTSTSTTSTSTSTTTTQPTTTTSTSTSTSTSTTTTQPTTTTSTSTTSTSTTTFPTTTTSTSTAPTTTTTSTTLPGPPGPPPPG